VGSSYTEIGATPEANKLATPNSASGTIPAAGYMGKRGLEIDKRKRMEVVSPFFRSCRRWGMKNAIGEMRGMFFPHQPILNRELV